MCFLAGCAFLCSLLHLLQGGLRGSPYELYCSSSGVLQSVALQRDKLMVSSREVAQSE
jgi:hypothetical protein